VRVQGIRGAGSVAEAVGSVDFVVFSLPATKDVEALLNQEDGIFKHAQKGTTIIDCSTIAPTASKQFAADAKKQGLTFVDAPMSGGTAGAQGQTLTFMVGAEAEHFAATKPVLEAMGQRVFHCGPSGSGGVVKVRACSWSRSATT
jgi:3-hydroxyisobutyrate dehydrogenase-like beta-hydroxyacid dehydrogenase